MKTENVNFNPFNYMFRYARQFFCPKSVQLFATLELKEGSHGDHQTTQRHQQHKTTHHDSHKYRRNTHRVSVVPPYHLDHRNQDHSVGQARIMEQELHFAQQINNH